MIREATPDDIPAIVSIAEEFYAMSSWAEIATPATEVFGRTVGAMIDAYNQLVVVAEAGGVIDGIGGAIVYPMFFASHVSGQCMFLRSHGQCGRALLSAMEEWARGKGAASFQVTVQNAYRDKAMCRVYRAAGYRATEQQYVKVI